jgi:conjugal transfer pilus assembly protein TrbC
MRTSPQTFAIALIAATSAIGGALAQSSGPDIDLASIRARGADQTAEAEALAASARERAKQVTSDASESAEAGKANGRRYAGTAHSPASGDTTFDFDRMVADAGDMAKDGLGEAPRFIAFASLSMPTQALRQMMDDVTRAGGVVVFRGLTQGSVKVMTEALGKVLKPGKRMDGVGIDPRLFRAFAVSEVPAYVVTASDFDLCSGFDCTSAVPPYDRMNGNVTAEYALRTFAEGGGPGARIAAQHLARLQADQP